MTTFTTVMKKVFLTIMSFVYLAAASGMSINMHYCMDKLVALGVHDAKECPACKTKEKSKKQLSCKCCKDEIRQVKLEKDHKAVQTIISKLAPGEVGHSFTSYHTFIIPFQVVTSYNINAPPQSSTIPAFLFNCVFRI